MPHHGLNLHAVGLLADLSTPELSDELEVLLVVEVDLACFVVFELRVVVHFEWDLVASEAPDTLNFKLGLFVEDAHSGQAVLSEVVESLQETLHQVLGFVELFTLTLVLVIVEEPE